MAAIVCGNCRQHHGSVAKVQECYRDHPERNVKAAFGMARNSIPDGYYRVTGASGKAQSFHLVTDRYQQTVYSVRREHEVPIRDRVGIAQIRALIAADIPGAVDAYAAHHQPEL